MAELEGDYLVKSREEIQRILEGRWLSIFPNAYLGDDSILKIQFEILASQMESIFVSNQIVLEDIFMQTASVIGLEKYGRMFGIDRKLGLPSTGTVKFSGEGGAFIELGTELSTDSSLDDPIYFVTTEDGTIPNPGVPSACSAALGTAASNTVSGNVTYKVSFFTDEGETAGSAASQTVVAANNRVELTSIPIGGTGTVGRYIYRDTDGSGFNRIATINDNTAVTHTDSFSGTGGSTILSVSTAEQLSIDVKSEDVGEDKNVEINEIAVLVDSGSGVISVTNVAAFSGGTNIEDIEEFRFRLLDAVANSQSGSKEDLEAWAEEIEGVEQATAFPNDNEGTTETGHATVRISGPNGSIPSTAVQDEVLTYLESKDLAIIVLHVTTFTANPENVSVTITLESGYVLADIEENVKTNITTYINSLSVGGTMYIAGIIGAVFNVPGVANLDVTTPTSDQTQNATDKATPGTITVS